MVRPFLASEEHAYFLEIEILFNTLRRSASLLSPADWQVAQEWWSRGMPLLLVQSALENVFSLRRERGDSDRIQSLSYCQSAVENAFRHLQELGFGEHPTPARVSIRDRLCDLVDALGAFGEEHQSVILAFDEASADPAEVELELAALEERLAHDAAERLPPSERRQLLEELESRLEAALTPLRSRLDGATLERTRARTKARLLKELVGIPRLSLFCN